METKYNFIDILMFFIFLTSSFDIFLSFEIGGFTFRISQILSVVLFLIYIIKIIKKGKLSLPMGYKALLMWTLLLLFFTFNTVLPSINIAYHLWLIFNILLIFSFVELIDDENKMQKTIKLYILTFNIMALIGILQFIFCIINVRIPYITDSITQWWFLNKFPRINGFSYEPSYYATYLLMGWVLCRNLMKEKEISKQLKINIRFITIIITIAIILSSSRMGILLMLAYETTILLKSFFQKGKLKYILAMLLMGTTICITIIIISQTYNLNFLLSGTGINGSASHSVTERENNFSSVYKVFKESPIFGRGLGGIYAEIANNKGLDIKNINVQDSGSAINIFVEVLSASGIIGFMFFIKYIYDICIKPIKLSRNAHGCIYIYIYIRFQHLQWL